ncbi:hypothetical protein T439DRAFT_384462 [Meredithblackwellia eburnea MCA 4105]
MSRHSPFRNSFSKAVWLRRREMAVEGFKLRLALRTAKSRSELEEGVEVDAEKVERGLRANSSNDQRESAHGFDLAGGQENSSERIVQRKLKARHLQMIALGGTIGTGLFVGAGGALATGGPLGIFLGYLIMGFVCWCLMIALGEMTTLFPVNGSFTHYSSRWVDPALGFTTGWVYSVKLVDHNTGGNVRTSLFVINFSQLLTLFAVETHRSAAALVINYWPGGQKINPAAWITLFFGVIVAFNFVGVRAYGEAEFIFSVIKIVTIVGLILLGIVITCGGGPDHQSIGFRFWREDGPFQQLNGIPGPFGRFLSFWTVFIQAAFSFLGTEIVAITAAEAENPRKNVPLAIKKVFFRIALFYVVGTFVMGLLVSPNNPNLLTGSGTAASPWVIAIENAGIKGLPSLINVVVLLAAFSAGNSDCYAASRCLGVPIYALIVTCMWGFLSYMMCGSASAATVFNWFYSLSSLTGLAAWATILLTYIRFHAGLRHQGFDRNTLPYKAPLQPYASYFALTFIVIVVFFNGYTVFLKDSWNTSTFIVDYITIPLFAMLYVFWKLYKK